VSNTCTDKQDSVAATSQITPMMAEAGAEIIRAEMYDLDAAQLAREVFAAMIAERDSRSLRDGIGPLG